MTPRPDTALAIAGLGAIGLSLAKAVDAGRLPGYRLVAVSSRDANKARAAVAGFAAPPEVVGPGELARAEIVVEAAPAAAFLGIARPVLAAGRTLVACSGGALMRNFGLVAEAEAAGARIVVPTGALIGLDAVRAAAQGRIESVVITTRKAPRGWAGAPYLAQHGIGLDGLTEPRQLFRGNALEAAAGFPANVNVAALAMAGAGPERTIVELWADPGVTRNTHSIAVESDVARFSMRIEGIPDPANPRTGLLTPLSVIACLRGMRDTLKVGT